MKTTNNQQPNVPGWGKRKIYRKVRVKENQLIWIVYEKPNSKGHIMTATDAYRNILGRTTEHFDIEKNQFNYAFTDAEGKELFKSDDLEKLKQQVSENKQMLFDLAYQKRLESLRQLREQKSQEKGHELSR